MGSVSYTSPGSYNFIIPTGAYNITATVRGARGGTGGTDNRAGGVPGTSRQQRFDVVGAIPNNRSCTAYVGSRGLNGVNAQGNAAGGSGGNGYGVGNGGRGGNAGDPPFSGGGGGGGGASGLYIDGVATIIMGGSGGGGGASANREGRPGDAVAVAVSDGNAFSGSNGGGGGDPGGTDGGGGGGGGGGVAGGGGGQTGIDNNRGGGGGGAGGSRYRNQLSSPIPSADVASNENNGFVEVIWTDLVPPTINSFTANPNPVQGSSGDPSFSTSLVYNISGIQVTSAVITSGGFSQSVGAPGAGSINVSNLPQSTVPGNSPATRTFTLTVTNPVGSDSRSVTVQNFSDNTPSNIIAPTIARGTQSTIVSSIDELESNTEYYVEIEWGGVDFLHNVSTVQSFVRVGNNTTNWSTDVTTTTLGRCFVRFVSLPFNPSKTPSGIVNGEVVGQYNTKTVTITIGSTSYTFNARTRRPVLQEIFDMEGQPLSPEAFPNPDIDTVTPDVNEEFVVTNQVITNDIEIPVEVKTDASSAQVRVNGGGWQDMREIGTP